ncbi:MAG: glycosyltransferase [Prevotella sp.]|nr:glycosyltransferase [Prevotella sp.]
MKYSIITINFNNRDGLRKTIESVVRQTCKDYEFIVIDGGSTDGSADVIREHEAGISYWVSEHDNGIYHAMNKGIAQAHGEYLNFMNSGDCFYNERVLEDMKEKLGGHDIVVGRDYHYDEHSGLDFTTILPKRVSMITFYTSYLPHQATFFKAGLFADTLYDTSLSICSDLLFYIQKIVSEGCTVHMTDIIVCRREQNGISTTQNDRAIEERKQILNRLVAPGIRKDYDSLTRLDLSTAYKLLELCDHPRTARYLTLCIKLLHRLFLR